jgi:hypothetical protein
MARRYGVTCRTGGVFSQGDSAAAVGNDFRVPASCDGLVWDTMNLTDVRINGQNWRLVREACIRPSRICTTCGRKLVDHNFHAPKFPQRLKLCDCKA